MHGNGRIGPRARKGTHGGDSRQLSRGASRISADFYGKAELFGLIPVGFGPLWPSVAGYGVLTWRTFRIARHVCNSTAALHAIKRPFVPRVDMACNMPKTSYLQGISHTSIVKGNLAYKALQ